VTERIQAAADRKAKRLAAMLERSQTDLTAARLALRAQTSRQRGEAEVEVGMGEEEEPETEAQVSQRRQMQVQRRLRWGRGGRACDRRDGRLDAEWRRGSF